MEVSFNRSGSKLKPHIIYELAQEYLNHAYSISSKVTYERQLQQYYKLISVAIQCFQHIKSDYQLTIEQDAKVTLEMVTVLLHETHNLELAENYLSSLRERLNNHQLGLMKEKMHCHFLSLYELPRRRSSEYYYKMALRSCDTLVEYLKTLTSTEEIQTVWLPLFKYVSIWLSIQIGKHTTIRTKFYNLLQSSLNLKDDSQWEAFVLLSYMNYMLDQRYTIPEDVIDRLKIIKWEVMGPKLNSWKLIIILLTKIYKDENITNTLTEFKAFFSENKELLSDDIKCTISCGTGLSLEISLPAIFSYTDIKNMLLLFQSISYLVNCYDKKANFSTKFLPKVRNTTSKLLKTINNSTASNSLSYWDSKVLWYNSIDNVCQFYQSWELLILNAQVNVLSNSEGEPTLQSSFSDYSSLLTAASHQLHSQSKLNSLTAYHEIIDSKSSSSELKMISLLNSYTMVLTQRDTSFASKSDTLDQNSIWQQIEKVLNESDLIQNPIWDCTVTMLWIIAHFEPFTSNPLPCTDEVRSTYLEKLRLYYTSNKLIGLTAETINDLEEKGEYLKLKKGLLLQLILNYLGARLFEHDLDTICKISEICFQISKQQDMLNIRYIMGLWHLMNCTSAMKTKDVIITKAKLKSLVRGILHKNEEDSAA